MTVLRNTIQNVLYPLETSKEELGQNKQMQACQVSGIGVDTSFPVLHDLRFRPTWVQVETCYHTSSQTGFVAPVLIGTPGSDLRFDADATQVWVRLTGTAQTSPVTNFILRCGRTHTGIK